MARKVTKVGSQPVRYVPDVGDNRKDSSPFVVTIIPMSGEELQEFRHTHFSGSQVESKDLLTSLEKRTWDRKVQILKEKIVAVENYEVVTIDGKIMSPLNGTEFVLAALSCDAEELAVLEDIFQAVISHSRLSEGALKNFD